jgi:predicted RNA methylase
MIATALLPVAVMLLMAAIEIAVACCVWLRVDDECCGCWLFDAGVIVAGAAAVCCVG